MVSSFWRSPSSVSRCLFSRRLQPRNPGIDLALWQDQPVGLTFTARDLPGRAGVQASGIADVQVRERGGLEWLRSSALPPGTPAVRDSAAGAHYVGGVAIGQRLWAASGEWSSLSYSDDLGRSWQKKGLGLTITAGAVECPTAGTVWVANAGIDTWAARSTDGGDTWVACAIPGYVEAVGPLACRPGAADRAWIAGRVSGVWGVWATADGGATWARGVVSGGVVGVIRDLACAPDGQTLWAAGDGGMILHSADGGSTWSHQTASVTGDLLHVVCRDQETAWAFSDTGENIWTRDGGATWTSMSCRWPAGQAAGLLDVVPTGDAAFVGLGWGFGAPVLHGDDADADGVWDITPASSDRIYGVSPVAQAGIVACGDGSGIAWDGQLAEVLVGRGDAQVDWVDHLQETPQPRVDLGHVVNRDGTITVDSRAVDAAGNVEAPAQAAPVVRIDTVAPLTLGWGWEAADNPGGSGLVDISVRATETRWSGAAYAPYADAPATTMVHDLTSIDYADGEHAVAGWQNREEAGVAGVIVTGDCGSTWAAYESDLGADDYYPEMIDVAGAWLDPTFHQIEALKRNAAAGADTYRSLDVLALTDWQASVRTLIGSWALRETAPGPFLSESEVKGIACPGDDPGHAWAVGDHRFWYKAGHAADDAWAEVPLGHRLLDVSAGTFGAAVRAWAVGAYTSVYEVGDTWANLEWSTGQEEDALVSVDCGVMADGNVHVWAVGPSAIIHSGDGGDTWTQTPVPEGHTFEEVSIGYRSVFALADNASVWRRTIGEDGSWSGWIPGTTIAEGYAVRSMAAASDTELTAVGMGGAIWQTRTASPIWQQILAGVWPTPDPGVLYEYRAVDLAGNVEETRTHTAP